MADAANWGLGAANPYLGQQNPYLQQIIDSGSADLVNNYNQAVVPAQNAAMLKSGSFGNSGLQELAARDQKGLQDNLADMSSKLRYNDYTQQQGMFQWDQQAQEAQRQFDEGTRRYEQNFGRDTFNDAYSQNRQNLVDGVGLLGTMSGFNSADINNSTTQQNAPLNYWNTFQNAANGLANGFGTTTSTQGTTSNPVLSALGGAQLGSSWFNSSNSSAAPSTSGSNWNWGGVDSSGYNSSTGGWWA